jgi:hypothetical protein
MPIWHHVNVNRKPAQIVSATTDELDFVSVSLSQRAVGIWQAQAHLE